MKPRRFGPGREALAAWAAVSLVLGILSLFEGSSAVQRILPTLALFLFLYVPPLFMRLRGGSREWIDGLFDGRAWLHGLGWAAVAALAVFPFYAAGHHYWMVAVQHKSFIGVRSIPPSGGWAMFALSQMLVAFAEEFFYRGYLLERFNQEHLSRRKLLGVKVGAGFVLQALLFAAGHVLVGLNPLRAAVFFPALLFAWLRIRTGSLAAPVWLHAMANLFSAFTQGWYK